MAQGAHDTHDCLTHSRIWVPTFPGTPVSSLDSLSSVGDYFLMGDSHFRCSPAEITQSCLLCGQMTLYDVSSPLDLTFHERSDFLPIDLAQEVHLTTSDGDVQIICLCATSPGLASIPRPSVYMQAPFWLLNTQQATIC